MVGEVAITKDREEIGKLAVITKKDPANDIVTFGFLDKSLAGSKACSSFLSCYLKTAEGSHYLVDMNDCNLLKLIDAFEKKKDVEGTIDMKQDLQTFDYYYIVTARV